MRGRESEGGGVHLRGVYIKEIMEGKGEGRVMLLLVVVVVVLLGGRSLRNIRFWDIFLGIQGLLGNVVFLLRFVVVVVLLLFLFLFLFLDFSPQPLSFHIKIYFKIISLHQGRFIASCARDQTVRVWARKKKREGEGGRDGGREGGREARDPQHYKACPYYKPSKVINCG